MPVVVCSSCKARINVKDEMLGRKAKCPKCATLIVLEVAEEAPSSAAVTPQKPKRRPTPPPLEEEDNPFAIQGDALPKAPRSRKAAPEPAFEAVEDDEPEEAEEEEPPRRSRRGADEEDEDEAPRAKKRRRRDEDDDDDRDIRRGGGWSTVRSGLRVVFFATLVMLGFFVFLQITSIASVIVLGSALPMNNPGPRKFPGNFPARQVGAGFAVFGLIALGLGIGLIGAVITHLVGQVMCCFGPPGAAQRSARTSMYALLAVIVIGILGMCGFFVFGMAVAGGNPPDRQGAVGMAMGLMVAVALFGLALFALGLAYLIFWVLFHSAVAGHFKDKALQSQFMMYLAAVIVVPFLSVGLNVGMAAALLPNNFLIHGIASNFFGLIFNGALLGWYLLLNKRLVALIDDNT